MKRECTSYSLTADVQAFQSIDYADYDDSNSSHCFLKDEPDRHWARDFQYDFENRNPFFSKVSEIFRSTEACKPIEAGYFHLLAL